MPFPERKVWRNESNAPGSLHASVLPDCVRVELCLVQCGSELGEDRVHRSDRECHAAVAVLPRSVCSTRETHLCTVREIPLPRNLGKESRRRGDDPPEYYTSCCDS